MNTKPTTDERSRLIKLIHVGKRELSMDDQTYRDILRQKASGKDSASALSVPELERVVAHMKSCGFKVRVKPGTTQRQRGARALADDDQSKMMRGIWLELHAMSIVRDPSEAALASFVCRHTKIEALQWLTSKQASSMIEHLKKWRNRIMTERTHALLTALGMPSSPDMQCLDRYRDEALATAQAALGKLVHPVMQSQADFDKILATARSKT